VGCIITSIVDPDLHPAGTATFICQVLDPDLFLDLDPEFGTKSILRYIGSYVTFLRHRVTLQHGEKLTLWAPVHRYRFIQLSLWPRRNRDRFKSIKSTSLHRYSYNNSQGFNFEMRDSPLCTVWTPETEALVHKKRSNPDWDRGEKRVRSMSASWQISSRPHSVPNQQKQPDYPGTTGPPYCGAPIETLRQAAAGICRAGVVTMASGRQGMPKKSAAELYCTDGHRVVEHKLPRQTARTGHVPTTVDKKKTPSRDAHCV
jgi:hypothetical protein